MCMGINFDQTWDIVPTTIDLERERLDRWADRVSQALRDGDVTCGTTTLAIHHPTGVSAATWALRYSGHCFLKGLVVWKVCGWQQAAKWAPWLATDLPRDQGGAATYQGAEKKQSAPLPTMVVAADPPLLKKWVTREEGNPDKLGAYIARAVIECVRAEESRMACG